jgi:hypothetical protein
MLSPIKEKAVLDGLKSYFRKLNTLKSDKKIQEAAEKFYEFMKIAVKLQELSEKLRAENSIEGLNGLEPVKNQ